MGNDFVYDFVQVSSCIDYQKKLYNAFFMGDDLDFDFLVDFVSIYYFY